MAWLNGQEPEEEDWKTKKSEEETFLWEWTRSMEIFVSQVNIHQKASNTEEALNKQEDRMMRPATLIDQLAQWVHKWSSHVTELEAIYGSKAWLPLTKLI